MEEIGDKFKDLSLNNGCPFKLDDTSSQLQQFLNRIEVRRREALFTHIEKSASKIKSTFSPTEISNMNETNCSNLLAKFLEGIFSIIDDNCEFQPVEFCYPKTPAQFQNNNELSCSTCNHSNSYVTSLKSETLQYLLQRVREMITDEVCYKEKALMSTATGDLKGVSQLLAQGIDANTSDSDGNTLLFYAVWFSYLNIVQLLLDYGAQVDVVRNNKRTPLNIAFSLLPQTVPMKFNDRFEILICLLNRMTGLKPNFEQTNILFEYIKGVLKNNGVLNKNQVDQLLFLLNFVSKEQFVDVCNKLYLVEERNCVVDNILVRLKDYFKIGYIVGIESLSRLLKELPELKISGEVNTVSDRNSSFKFTDPIFLACKYNHFQVLTKVVLNENSDFYKFFNNIEKIEVKPDALDDAKHNAFYYAIRSSNIEILDILCTKLLNNEKLGEYLSNAYNELKLFNVTLTEDMEIFIEDKLINLRFYQKKSDPIKHSKPSLTDVQTRIDIVVKAIDALNELEEVNDEFIFISRFIAKNLYVLKRILKSTYTMFPWEEMEFCLVCFVASKVKEQEINYIINAYLTKNKILFYLNTFKDELQKFQPDQSHIDYKSLKKSNQNETRKEVIDKILLNNNKFIELFSDYEKIKDIYSLDKIRSYVKVALNDHTKLRSLLVERALQVTGEYLKNTLESPHMSKKLSDLLFYKLNNDTKEIITGLRDRLSHSLILGNRIQTEKLSLNLENDLQKLLYSIDNVIFNSKIDVIQTILKNITNCTNLNELKEYGKIFKKFKLHEIDAIHFSIKELSDTKKSIDEYKLEIKDPNIYENDLFNKIYGIIDAEKMLRLTSKIDYLQILGLLIKIIENLNSNVNNIKSFAKRLLIDMHQSDNKNDNITKILHYAQLIYESYINRLNIKTHFKTNTIIYNIYCNIKFKFRNINEIKLYKDSLEVNTDYIYIEKEIQYILQHLKSNMKEHYEKIVETIFEYKEQYEIKQNISDLLDNLIENEITEIDDEMKTKFELLRKKLKIQKKKSDTLKECFDRKEFYNCKQQIQLDTYKIFLSSVKDFVKTGEFLNVSKSFVAFFDGNLKTILKSTMGDIVKKQNEEFQNHLKERLKTLKELFSNQSSDCMNWETIKKIKNNVKLQSAIEMLVLDITAFLEEKSQKLDKSHQHSISSFLDKEIELLTGKQLRNYLAHGNALVEILLTNPTTAVISNALKFVRDEETILEDNNLIIAQNAFGIDFLENHYQKSLKLLKNKEKIFLTSENRTLNKLNSIRKEGADLKSKDINQWTIFHHSAKGNNLEIFNLLQHPDFRNELTLKNSQQFLAIAALNGREDIIKRIIKNTNIDINMKLNIENETLLHIASKHGYINIFNFLIDNKANINCITESGVTILHLAAEYGRENIIKLLLDKNLDFNIKDNFDFTPLHYAIKNGHIKIMKIILKKFPHFCKTTIKKGLTYLHYAATYGHLNIVKMLLYEHKFDVSVRDEHGLTPLHYAAHNGHFRVVKFLINKTDDINKHISHDGTTPLHLATKYNHSEIVKLLIRAKADVSPAGVGDAVTPLHFAIQEGHLQVAKLLISRGADINAVTTVQLLTPLHYAVYYNRIEFVKELLLRDCLKIDPVNTEGVTPLHLAAQDGSVEILIQLLNRNADVSAKTAPQGYTPLMIAVQNGHLEAVKILLNAGANVNAANYSGETSLNIAAGSGHRNITEHLLNYENIDVNITNNEGRTPLHSAAQNGHYSIVELLLDKGVNPNAANTIEGAAALHVAAQFGYVSVAETLLKHKNTNPNFLANNGFTPLFIAAQNGHLKMVELLLDNGANINISSEEKDDVTNPLAAATILGHEEIVELLKNRGFSSNINDM